MELGSYSYFGYDCKIYASELSKVIIGSNCAFNSNVMINARGNGTIVIGDNVLIGPNVVLRSSDHSFGNLEENINKQGMTDGNILIKDNVWIGSNVLNSSELYNRRRFNCSSRIGCDKRCFTFSVVGGIPAKIIKKDIER